MIAAGRLRHRVILQEYRNLMDSNGDAIQDPNTGEVSREWVEIAQLWAAIEPLSAREFIAAQATQSKVTTRIVIRHRAIAAGNRLIHNGLVYNIEGVLADPVSGLEYITLPCSQGVSTTGQ